MPGRATILLKNKKAITEGITAVVNPDVCVDARYAYQCALSSNKVR